MIYRTALFSILSLFAASAASATESEFRPFDENTLAMQDVDAALLSARATDRLLLLVLGGNWCHDSRGLARNLATPELAGLVNEYFVLVYVDVGHRDRNLEVARRFGVNELLGTPTIIILSGDGELLNADTVHAWRDADSRSIEEVKVYLSSFLNAPANNAIRNYD